MSPIEIRVAHDLFNPAALSGLFAHAKDNSSANLLIVRQYHG